jgi:hypothetical protein
MRARCLVCLESTGVNTLGTILQTGTAALVQEIIQLITRVQCSIRDSVLRCVQARGVTHLRG